MVATVDNRAGCYMSQIGGYQAFVPKPLPPDPPVQLDAEMLQLLSRAEGALERLDGADELLPIHDVDLFIAMYMRREAVFSSLIAGRQASLANDLPSEIDAAESGNPQGSEEVANYIQALNYGLQRFNTLPLSLRLMREIHCLLLQGGRGANQHPGEFRTSQNWIGHQGGTLEAANFVPPSPDDMVNALRKLVAFIHGEKDLPILIKVGLVHAQFETIHPFLDGNGRMGRLLITFILCQENVLRKPLLCLSHFFKLHRSEYDTYLQNVRDEGDWESWLKFFLRAVHDVAQETTIIVQNLVRQREKYLYKQDGGQVMPSHPSV